MGHTCSSSASSVMPPRFALVGKVSSCQLVPWYLGILCVSTAVRDSSSCVPIVTETSRMPDLLLVRRARSAAVASTWCSQHVICFCAKSSSSLSVFPVPTDPASAPCRVSSQKYKYHVPFCDTRHIALSIRCTAVVPGAEVVSGRLCETRHSSLRAILEWAARLTPHCLCCTRVTDGSALRMYLGTWY